MWREGFLERGSGLSKGKGEVSQRYVYGKTNMGQAVWETSPGEPGPQGPSGPLRGPRHWLRGEESHCPWQRNVGVRSGLALGRLT